MATEFEFLSTSDRPALIAFSNPGWLEEAKNALVELGYKVHTAATHADFLERFAQVRYEVAMIEECFAANDISENVTLQALQEMPASLRHHATVLLVGESFQTFTPMEAFQQSVHAVINTSEIFLLRQLVEKTVADNALFLKGYREAQSRLISGQVVA